jgi:hypothetical protein
VKDILSNLHQIIKCLLLELVGEAADDLLSHIAVDSNTKAELEDNQEGFLVDKCNLVKAFDTCLLDIILHRQELHSQSS